MDAGDFATAWLDRLDHQTQQLEPARTGEIWPLRERAKLASWLARERATLTDLTPELDAIIGDSSLVPGVTIPRVIRDEAQRMREAWEESKADDLVKHLQCATQTMTIRLARDKRGGSVRLLSTSENLDWSPTFDIRIRFSKGSFDERTMTWSNRISYEHRWPFQSVNPALGLGRFAGSTRC